MTKAVSLSRESGYAIKIKSCALYDDPVELRSVYGSNPPQSFALVYYYFVTGTVVNEHVLL